MFKKLVSCVLISLQVIAYIPAYAVTISQTPIGLTVKPNLILGFDDSGSMRYEVLMGGLQGVANFDNQTYQYLFPGSGTIVPTSDSAAQFRSSDYNPIYYNPNITYTPWVKTVNSDKTFIRYDSANATAAKYDPTGSDTSYSSSTLNLTGSVAGGTSTIVTPTQTSYTTSTIGFTISSSGTVSGVVTYDCVNWKTTIQYSSGNKTNKAFSKSSSCTSATTKVTFTKNYKVQKGQTWTVNQTVDVSTTVTLPAWYWATYYKKVSANCGSCVAAPDTGFWLQKIVIAANTDEMQNFANWFQYARSRRLLMNYAMSSVLSSISGMRVGMIPFNSSNTFKMYDVDTASDTTELLGKIYTTKSTSTTPTLDNLKSIGEKFNTDTSVIQYSCQKNAAFILTDGYANVNVNNVTPPSYDSSKWGSTAPYTTTKAKSLADISLSYYTNRLRSSDASLIAGQVPKDNYTTDGSADQNTDLHMNTYALTLGADGVDYQDGIDPYANPPTWDTPVSNDPTMIDDLWHGTINGRGKMFSADNVTNLINSIKNAFVNISLRAGTRASIGVASKYINATNNAVYMPSYNATGWVGDVKKLTIDLATAAIDTTTAVWSAKDQLDSITTPETDRKIITYTGSAGASFSASTTGLSSNLVSYIRGSSALEGTTYRKRVSLFGDVINASPTVVVSNGITTVYQAANDGMVHAIDGATGDELWAYVPKVVWGQFNNFASLTGSHEYIVDGTPIAAKVGDKTIIVGGLGYNSINSTFYALNITSPVATSEADAASKVLWEFPSATVSALNGVSNRANLGTSTARPLIIKTSVFSGLTNVVVVSSGYNNGTGTGQSGGDGKGHVWFLNPTTGAVLKEIVTATGSTTTPIGLAPLLGFAANPKLDATATALYGGDEVGNIWKFDISSSSSSSWTSSAIATLKTAGGAVQPVTSAIQLSIDPIDMKPLIFAGTGQLLNSSDVSDTTQQSFYAIKDNGTTLTRSDLVNKVVTGTATTDRTIADPTGVTFDWSTKKGWFFDFPTTGERVVGNIQFSTDRLLFATTVISSNTCTNPTFTYSLDNKGAGKYPVLAVDGVTLTMVGGHYTGQASSTSPLIIIIQSGTYGVQTDASGKITVFKINTLSGGSRLASWREIIRK